MEAWKSMERSLDCGQFSVVKESGGEVVREEAEKENKGKCSEHNT